MVSRVPVEASLLTIAQNGRITPEKVVPLENERAQLYATTAPDTN